MMRAYCAGDVQAAEAPLLAATAPDELMQHAAFAVATTVLGHLRRHRRRERHAQRRVLLLVGGGNNGGDALYAGAYLARRGVSVTALVMTTTPHSRALATAHSAGVRCRQPVLDGEVLDGDVLDSCIVAAAGYPVWVDGLTGIGARGGLREPVASLVRQLQRLRENQPVAVVAIDVPSGIGVDDGSLPGPVLQADITVTMGQYKPGLLLPPAGLLAGDMELIDIGLNMADHGPQAARLSPAEVGGLVVQPTASDHKYTRGVLGLLAGSADYPGAGVLAASGALGTGIGMLRYLGPQPVVDLMHHHMPETVPGSGRVQAWAVGSGIDPDDEQLAGQARSIIAEALAEGQPIVLDAGALSMLPDRLAAHAVLTPHAGELAHLLTQRGASTTRQAVEAEPLAHARAAVSATGATILLKGAITIAVGPHGLPYGQAEGSPWLATAGTGDVLTGILGALLATHGADLIAATEDQGDLAAQLAASAAALHGMAGKVAAGGGPLSAYGVSEALPDVIRHLSKTD